jgi:hypothetical protein
MPWGQEKPDLVWINLDYIILRNQKPKKTKKTKKPNNKETKKTGKKQCFPD